MGNLRSVQKAFERLGVAAEICSRPEQLSGARKLVLPGVGAFRDAIGELKRHEMVQPVLDHIHSGKPFLGICLGMQMLFEVSHEDGEWEGLGVLPGSVERFEDQPGLKIPHMGWNVLERNGPVRIFDGIPSDAHFYFVHSYHVVPAENDVVAAWTQHGTRFASAVARDNLFATQFHPEKSQRVGLKLLQNFAAL